MFNHYRSNDKLCIYRITDIETGMKYVGQTFNTCNRLRIHRTTGPFSTLLKEKGFASIEFDILEQDVEEDDADDRERHYVTKLNTLEPNGYNKITGGKKDGMFSVLTREEMKERAVTLEISAKVSVITKDWFEQEGNKDKHKSSLNATDVQKRRSTSRQLHYDEKRNQLLPQFKKYRDEYKEHGSMKTIMNLMNISQNTYYKLLNEVQKTTSIPQEKEDKLTKLLPQFKMYTNEYKGWGSMTTILNLMNISQNTYYKLLKMSTDIMS